MPQTRFFKNPNYCEYIRHLAQLHSLIARHDDEGMEGQRLRDQMDDCSADFGDDEVASLTGISSDFYSLNEQPADSQFGHGGEVQSAINAYRSKDYVLALAFLRQNQSMIEAPQLAYIRGRVFDDAGLPDIALNFYRFALSLQLEKHTFAV